ncbi:DNA polymerase III, epsilon subunit [Corynebacterium appendicis CIP 107643]|uniref:DNA polymerase III, epsilon subunit n=1 Tax=Corynebacterium appendicis CIP 107643 TaxID=1161099 RepID=A0A1N7IP36_9CORY|nr:DNA polymerase III subunit epsilon [Corynebacterium appendicis]WJY60080.1 DNA polymerase III subunit epsilon [Corynebacterium appendicis CIP 107643]SIS38848.1 DNA polymerase III, epsilon subunit [Corynebacterium appendicis CIP 107643]
MVNNDTPTPNAPASTQGSNTQQHELSLPEKFPFAAFTAQTTNIHPSSGRLVTLDGVAFDSAGVVGEEFHAVFNVGGDPGPMHTHGVKRNDFERAAKFSRHLKKLDKFIDNRTLIVHDAPLVWGFIVSEARRAMNAAARANRSRNRRGGRRRQRVGHVPRPEGIVDTLASARKQGAVLIDERLEAVASLSGVAVPPAQASLERAAQPEEETSRGRTLALVSLYMALAEAGPLVTRATDELAPDRFGLQRTQLRVDAEKASAQHGNPGQFTHKSGLRPGMEVVVSDDIRAEHDELIQAIMDLEMTYAEKLTRETSLVVTNATGDPDDLRGKAMHAHRKGIPLVSDEDFLAAVETEREVRQARAEEAGQS